MMAGLASVVFAACYWLVDQRGGARYTTPFAVYGMNAITVYLLSGVTGRLLGLIQIGGGPAQRWIFQTFFAPLASPVNASLLYGLVFVLYLYAVAWVMYRRGWFLKL